MLLWMTYLAGVSLLLTVAALLGERVVRRHRAPARAVWIFSMIASFAIPALFPYVHAVAPAETLQPTAAPVEHATGRQDAAARAHSIPSPSASLQASLVRYDRPLLIAWLVASLSLLAALAACHAQWHRRARNWKSGTLGTSTVHFSGDVGPAVIGLLRNRIIIPLWLKNAPRAQQMHVLAHEQQHLHARDPQLLSFALIMLALMPWNPCLWFQLQRLRRAMEIDCDQRVLDSGLDAIAYSETLLTVGQHQTRYFGTAIALAIDMAEPVSLLEERIAIMISKPLKIARTVSLLIAGLSLTLIAVATQVTQPPAVDIRASQLDSLVGTYRYADNSVLNITRDGNRLLARFSSQSAPDELSARSGTQFAYPYGDARLEFQSVGEGRAPSVWLFQNGAITEMPRIDAQAAQQIESARAKRVANATAAPGSEAAVRQLIEGIQAGKPDLSRLNPQLAGAFGKDWPMFRKELAPLGALDSLTFKGIDENGFDAYEARHAHGTSTWAVAVDGNGIVTGALAPVGHPSN